MEILNLQSLADQVAWKEACFAYRHNYEGAIRMYIEARGVAQELLRRLEELGEEVGSVVADHPWLEEET